MKSATRSRIRNLSYTIPWNMFMITLGAFGFSFGIKAVALPQEFISGGVGGVALILYYVLQTFSPGIWLLLLNIPIFILGWICVSRRFFLYSLYGMLLTTLFLEIIPGTWALTIEDRLLSAMAGGVIMGAGLGTALRSMGSVGGLDIISVYINQRFNIGIGKMSLMFNTVLFCVSMFFIGLEQVLYSLFLVFVSAMVIDYFLGLFNQRKMVLIVSEKPGQITEAIQNTLHRGSTYLYGRGAYTNKPKKIVLTVVNSLQLKRLEEIIFSIDPKAFTIEENTLNVIGQGFSRRKVY
jgi:uncharacterized membrane-anchored protein YitT (DUF2179 family)